MSCLSTSRVIAVYSVPGPSLTPETASTSMMMPYPCLGPSERLSRMRSSGSAAGPDRGFRAMYELRYITLRACPQVTLRDRESQCAGVVPHTLITRHDGHELWRLAEEIRRGEMYGVERPNLLDGKRATAPIEHRLIDGQNKAAQLKRSQRERGRLFFLDGQSTGGAGAHDRPSGLGQCQRGRDVSCPGWTPPDDR